MHESYKQLVESRLKKQRESGAKHRKKFPERHRKAHYKRKYGLDPKEYDLIFERQEGCCAICKKEESGMRLGRIKSLSVDHCHTTGKVRGLLCQSCNTGIGLLKEDTKLFMAAIEYLEKSRDIPSQEVAT